MKRRPPFRQSDFEKNSNGGAMPIFDEYSSFPNETSKKYLSNPKFLPINDFPSIIRFAPVLLIDPRISIGLSTSKETTNELLSGSFLEANTLFGMDIERFSHINDVENFAKNTSHCVVNCLKSFYDHPIDFLIEIKSKNVFVNQKKIPFKKSKLNSKICKIEISKHESLSIILFEEEAIHIKCILKSEVAQEDYKSISIESDLPIVLYPEDDKKDIFFCTKLLRIICPTLKVSVKLKSNIFDFFIASECRIIKEIICNKSFVIRASSFSLKRSLEAIEFVLISSESIFEESCKLKTQDLCCIFAEESFKCLSQSIRVSNNTFIKSKSILFKSKHKPDQANPHYFQISSKETNSLENELNSNENENNSDQNEAEISACENNKDQNDLNSSENENELTQNDGAPNISIIDQSEPIQPTSVRQNCILQADKVAIGPNYSIYSSIDFTIETSDLTISQTNTTLNVQNKLYLLFLTDKDKNCVGKSRGTITCYDLFLEMDSTDNSSVVKSAFENHGLLTVRNACLIESGLFCNYFSVSIRSLYLSAFSQFKNLKSNSIMKFGDLLAIEKDAEFVNEGQLLYFKYLKPIILNSGKMILVYKGQYINNHTLQCAKFVSIGSIEGSYLSIDAFDLISISEYVKCDEIVMKAPEISIINCAKIFVSILELRAKTINFKTCSLNPLTDEDDEENTTSITMLYENELIGNPEYLQGFSNLSLVQSKYPE